MATLALENEIELLAKIAMGDQRAFKLVYDFYSRKTYFFALKVLNDEGQAEEVMQITMLKLWQIGDGLTEITNLDAYINVITRNTCYNLLRRLKLEQKANLYLGNNYSEIDDDTQQYLQLNETKRILQDAIDALPEYQRNVYKLCHQEGLKYEEVAKKLNLSHATVKTYMKLTLRFLREYLAKNGDMAALIVIFKLF